MAANTLTEMAWRTVLQNVSQLQNEEAKIFYLKGWVKAVNQNQTDAFCVQEALSQLVYDTDSIEVLLQKNAQYEIFFSSATKEKLGRFNRTLNIHWALDIVAQFPKQDESLRLSTNLNTWLHEVADEDDRDDVRSWAEKVKERKMSEEKFSEKIRSLK